MPSPNCLANVDVFWLGQLVTTCPGAREVRRGAGFVQIGEAYRVRWNGATWIAETLSGLAVGADPQFSRAIACAAALERERARLFEISKIIASATRTGYGEIPLSQGKSALVDSGDLPELLKLTWFAQEGVSTFYAVHTVNEDMSIIRMHVALMRPEPGLLVDHRNGNGLDNRRANLRICTHIGNNQNRAVSLQPGKSSRFKGVSWHAPTSKWHASIRANGKGYYLGLFLDEEGAARAYDTAAKRLHGEFARLNFSKGSAA